MLKKAIYFPFLIGMAQLPVITHAQLSKEKAEKHIVVNSKTIRVATLLGIFSKETDLEFSFNSKQLSPSREIPVTHHDQTLSAWLKELEKTTGIHVRVKGDHIILQDAPVPVHTATIRERAVVNTPAVKPSTIQRAAAANKVVVQPGENAPDITEKLAVNHGVAIVKHLHERDEVTMTDKKKRLKDVTDSQEYSARQQQRADSNARGNAVDIPENSMSPHRAVVLAAKGDAAYTADKPTYNGQAGLITNDELQPLPAYELPATDQQISIVNPPVVGAVKERAAFMAARQAGDTNMVAAPPLRKLTSLELGLQGIGLAFELPVARKVTVKFSGGLGGGYDLRNDFSYDWALADPCVYLSVNPRYYYNRDKRERKGKRNSLNAGYYIGLRVKYTSTSIIETDVTDAIMSNIHWGMQTPIGRKWVIDGHAGVGWGCNFIDTFNPIHSRFYPAVEIRFSYVLNKKSHL